jgi:LacI family transcriptional regulator
VVAVADPAISQAVRLIRERSSQGLRVGDVARHVHLSRSVLQRRFRAVIKRTVHQELVTARLKHAHELLVKTTLSLAAIAERTGFTHQEYMGAVFKSKMHKTPAQIRREGGRGAA